MTAVSDVNCANYEALVCSGMRAVSQLRRLVAGFPPRGQGSKQGQVMWDLWWTKRHWGRFSQSPPISPANHATDCSTLIIFHHLGLVH
jgi:hypothetical protein